MKERIIKIIIAIVIAIICGNISGNLVYNIYKEKTEEILNQNKVFLLQTGAFSSKESMEANSTTTNYMYYNDDGLYKTIVALTKNKDNINKIKDTYNVDIVINEYYLASDSINKKISYYDDILKKETNPSTIRSTITEMLELYQKEDITLTKNY